MKTLRELAVPRHGRDLRKVLAELMEAQQAHIDNHQMDLADEIQQEIDEVAEQIDNGPIVGSLGDDGPVSV